MQQVRFGIVGVGNMGSAHLSHILRGNVPVSYTHLTLPTTPYV